MRQLKVLIIDDDNDLRAMLEQLLRIHQTELALVGSVGRGIDGLILTKARKPDVVILDINLPEVSGTNYIDLLAAEGADIVVYSANEHYELHSHPSVASVIRKTSVRSLIEWLLERQVRV